MLQLILQVNLHARRLHGTPASAELIPPATFDTAYKKHGCIFESAGSVLHVEAGVLRDFTCMVSEHFDEPVQFIWRYYAGWPLCHQPADQQPQPKDRAERHQL